MLRTRIATSSHNPTRVWTSSPSLHRLRVPGSSSELASTPSRSGSVTTRRSFSSSTSAKLGSGGRTSSFLSTSSSARPGNCTCWRSLPGKRPSFNYAAIAHSKARWQSQRTFFGIGEIVGVLTNPGEVLKNLRESKRLLEETRQELQEQKERDQIPTSHTFSPLPGFYDRPKEIQALERALGSVPSFTVLFGASSVGKTALLRQVLSQEQYHCIHFDLRIAGFADLQSLYFSLCTQMEGYFLALPEMMGAEWGWDSFEKESWAFKHDRLAIEERVRNGGFVKTSDIAHLMELFQSALLKYWQFEPMSKADRQRKEAEKKAKEEGRKDDGKHRKEDSVQEKGKRVQSGSAAKKPRPDSDSTEAKMRKGAVPETESSQQSEADLIASRTVQKEVEDDKKKKSASSNGSSEGESIQAGEEEQEEPNPPPKKVPVFFLDEAHKLPALIKTDPDAMKCILDSFLVLTKQDRLCHVIHATSDPFYMHWLRQLNVMQHCNILSIGDCSKQEARAYFDHSLLPHIPDHLKSGYDFEELYQVFGGKLAHLGDYTAEHINSDGHVRPLQSSHFLQAHSLLNLQLINSLPLNDEGSSSTNGEGGAPGFSIYSPLVQASPHAAPSPFNSSASSQLVAAGASGASGSGADFSAAALLLVMSRLGKQIELPYFPLCRELGAKSVDGMVRGRVLELRWSATITEEREGAVEERKQRGGVQGPVVVATTPVLHAAMRAVLEEYKKEGRTIPKA